MVPCSRVKIAYWLWFRLSQQSGFLIFCFDVAVDKKAKPAQIFVFSSLSLGGSPQSHLKRRQRRPVLSFPVQLEAL